MVPSMCSVSEKIFITSLSWQCVTVISIFTAEMHNQGFQICGMKPLFIYGSPFCLSLIRCLEHVAIIYTDILRETAGWMHFPVYSPHHLCVSVQ